MVPTFLQKRRTRRQSLESAGLLLGFLLLAGIYCLAIVYLLTNRGLNQATKLACITVSLPAVLGIVAMLDRSRRS